MQLFKTTKSINFHNNTTQAITLEAWSEAKNGIASFKSENDIIGLMTFSEN